MSKVPITLISGFLGAGKTTFLNYILNEQHGKKIAVIQNEYGQEIGIETAMVVGKDGSKVSEWLEFPNGCICCTVKDDFVRSIEELLKKSDRFDYILIESTGMGDPGQISASLWVDDELESPIYLDSIVTIVDAKNILRQVDEKHPQMTDKKTTFTTEAERQIAFADVILLNKIDLVNDKQQIEQIHTKIKQINPLASIIHTERSVVDLGRVLDTKCYTPNLDLLKDYLDQDKQTDSECTSDCQHDGHHHGHGKAITSGHSSHVNTVCIKEMGSVDLVELNRWIGALVWEDCKDRVFRMKGLVSVKDEAEKYILQGVYETFDTQASGIQWTAGEPRENKLVFIGEDLDQESIQQSFKRLIVG
ncbi:hypothetical protein SAMD00019534_069360 [Acytostelium subglobosum LB1]|uniref:hypothetical protein n=1 Tax=Acytostelium subglobosum LB1 TaxID=1410327 RepID=UPI000644FA24|nr:hypothetical protein SAMD00019534_069360 [Acytostelium subglobosum LB1]GAM23761.1 hypothetical protein SAMD00019534_069360 [Acytostelium subglobosum LB1]|eukprot:XP_012753502.1 hypothetical protein SAMD00019534_069360 [Acytostelium subglobosum LB1]